MQTVLDVLAYAIVIVVLTALAFFALLVLFNLFGWELIGVMVVAAAFVWALSRITDFE